MLSERWPEERIRDALLPRERFRPYPSADEREPWKTLPQAIREEYVRRGEAALNYDWPTLKASLILDFLRDGNRENQGRARDERRSALANLVLAECIEGEGRFVDQIVNGIWATCEESYWGNVGALHLQKVGFDFPDPRERLVELITAETGALLAWTLYLLRTRLDDVSDLIAERILQELDTRLLTPALTRDDFWWMGFGDQAVNNWNPWICSNWLTAALLWERDAERRKAAVAKIIRCLDHYLDRHPRDGGCDEGPGYWGRAGATLFENLELLRAATNGAFDAFDEPLVREIGRFIYRVQIAGDYFVNFADASAVIRPASALVHRFGRAIGDGDMVALGAWAARRQEAGTRGFRDSIGRQLPALFGLREVTSAEGRQPLPRDVWLPEIQVMTARDREGTADGFFVASKGGHNAESHNHNDVGNAVVYIDGRPVLVDAGVEQYTRKTFSPQRYEIWTMRSAYHTLPTVNGAEQAPGEACAARDVAYAADDEQACLSMDISGAYPAKAGVRSWTRTVTLRRRREALIRDDYTLATVGDVLCLNLMTPCSVDVATPGRLDLTEATLPNGRLSGAAQIMYDESVFTVSTDAVPIRDSKMGPVWGDHLTRIRLTVRQGEKEGGWVIRVRR